MAMSAGPILMAIQPKVAGTPNTAWFLQYASGYVQWAQNCHTAMVKAMGIDWQEVEMGLDQYNRLLAMATNGVKGNWG